MDASRLPPRTLKFEYCLKAATSFQRRLDMGNPFIGMGGSFI
jgi:hypothetical protein